MDPSRWEKIKDAYAHASELAADEAEFYISSLPIDIRSEIQKLLAADSAAGNFIEMPFFVETGIYKKDGEELEMPPTREIDEYTLIEPIGTGGMGTVYLAEKRGEGFSQLVALKIIKRGMDTHAVLKRFLTERRILAGLEHQNIARMLDGGSTSDGVPYFVMEHVKGDPLKAYCEQRDLDIRARLGIFAKVCAAVNYAHQKLIVHRDIKPTNIIVTEDGEPKLLDFGIAKLLNPDRGPDNQTATATNFRVMTPEYASPEQIRGEPTSTLTDVYSLGVVLYELLTGVRPYQTEGGNPLALFHAMTSREPLKPSVAAGSSRDELTLADDKGTVAVEIHDTGKASIRSVIQSAGPDPRALRGDLDNIVMTAIRREPDRRYQSVQELLDDVERYLAGLPVRATGDSIGYRFGKFVNRHRAAVSAAVVIAIALFSAAAIAGYQYRQASLERAKAEARFAEGRKFANAVINEHYDRIRDLPGSTEAKAGLIADAVNYLDAVSKDSSGDADFQRELAKAYLKLAEIQGQTIGTGDLGDQSASAASTAKAIALLEQLVAGSPFNVEDQRLLAQSYSSLSYVSPVSERTGNADRSFEIYKTIRSINPDREQAESDYARALWDRANSLRRDGNSAEAIRAFTEAVSTYEGLYNDGAGNKRFRRSASLTYKNIGSVYRVTGDPASALASYEKALSYDKQIAAESRDNQEAVLGLSFSHRGVAEALTDLRNFDKAIAEFKEAISIQETTYKKDTKNAFLADNLHESYSGIAVAFRESADFGKAETYFQKAFELERTQASGTLEPLRRLSLAKTHLEFGDMLIRENKNDRARGELQIAKKVFDEVDKEGAMDPAFAPHYERIRLLLQNV